MSTTVDPSALSAESGALSKSPGRAARRLLPVVLLGLGLAVGFVVARGTRPAQPSADMLLHAAGATSNDAFAMATGTLADSEGVFTLDFLTGELTCIAVNPRTGKMSARFSINVTQAMGAAEGADKKPRYLLTVGQVDWRGGSGIGGVRPASSVAYVLDANTGALAAFSVPWNQQLWQTGGPMIGALVPVDATVVRNAVIEAR